METYGPQRISKSESDSMNMPKQDTQQSPQQNDNPQDTQQNDAPQYAQQGYEFADIDDDPEFLTWFHNEYFNMPNEQGQMNPTTKIQMNDGVLDLTQLEMMIPGFESYMAARTLGRTRAETQQTHAETQLTQANMRKDAMAKFQKAGGLTNPEVRAAMGEMNHTANQIWDEKLGDFVTQGQQLRVPDNIDKRVIFNPTLNIGDQKKEDPNKLTYAKYYLRTQKNLIDNDLKSGSIKINKNGEIKEIINVDFSNITDKSERAYNMNDDSNMVTVTYADGTSEVMPIKNLGYHKKTIEYINQDPSIPNKIGDRQALGKNTEFQKNYNSKETIRNVLKNDDIQLTEDSLKEFFGTGDKIANAALQRFNGFSSAEKSASVALANRILKSKLFENLVKVGYSSQEAIAEFNKLTASADLSNENGIQLLSDMISMLSNSYVDPSGNEAGMYMMDSQNVDLQTAVGSLRLAKTMLQARKYETSYNRITNLKKPESDEKFNERIAKYELENNNGLTEIKTGVNDDIKYIMDFRTGEIWKYNKDTKKYDKTDKNPFTR